MDIKWKNGADSPALLFIDDLANKWADANSDGKIQPDEDWGYAGFDDNGAFKYLEEEILSANPEVKVTFFSTVGARAPAIKSSRVHYESHPIDYNAKSISFFKAIADHPRFELAYHGTDHGLPGDKEEEFVQEWLSYKNLDDALAAISRGKDIYKHTIGRYPDGGKYCGYMSNPFSDESIDRSGFKWWCRYYNRAAIEGCGDSRYCGIDTDPETAFNVKFFGKNKIIDIPTTLSGNLCNPAFSRSGIKNILKKRLRPFLLRERFRSIDYLLKNRLVISIQEHISPSREDGIRQPINIFDDAEGLAAILSYLKSKSVWYCTGTELAGWVNEQVS